MEKKWDKTYKNQKYKEMENKNKNYKIIKSNTKKILTFIYNRKIKI